MHVASRDAIFSAPIGLMGNFAEKAGSYAAITDALIAAAVARRVQLEPLISTLDRDR